MVPRHRRSSESYSGRGVFNEVLQLEPHQLLVSRNAFRQKDTLNENIRFAQRSIESIITEILDDEKMPKDKKVDTLVKYHNALIKLKSS